MELMRFTNGGASNEIFPDGIVEVVEEDTDTVRSVRYVNPPEGLAARRFTAYTSELTSLEGPSLSARDWWVIVCAGLPTFYLNGQVQGILDADHAARVASSVIGRTVRVGEVDRLSNILT